MPFTLEIEIHGLDIASTVSYLQNDKRIANLVTGEELSISEKNLAEGLGQNKQFSHTVIIKRGVQRNIEM